MELGVVNEVFYESVDQYDRALSSIKHCLMAYERICGELINEISTAQSVEDAREAFNSLEEVQDRISVLVFNREISVGKELDVLVRQLDSLYDCRMKEYWFRKFKSGVKWPGE